MSCCGIFEISAGIFSEEKSLNCYLTSLNAAKVSKTAQFVDITDKQRNNPLQYSKTQYSGEKSVITTKSKLQLIQLTGQYEAQHKKSPICLFNNGQQLNTVQGGIA
jgi:hypothetical protein